MEFIIFTAFDLGGGGGGCERGREAFPSRLTLASTLVLFVCVVIQMRKNPPSPLHKGKRKSGHEKFSSESLTHDIYNYTRIISVMLCLF